MSDSDSTKRCCECGCFKPLGDFYRARREKDGRQRKCKLCAAAYNKNYLPQWRKDNAAKQQLYFQQWLEVNRDHKLATDKAYRDANPELRRAANRNRKARARAAEGKHTAADVAAKLNEQRGRCYWCSARLRGEYHVDHIIPIAKGGSNWPANICCACPTCNLSKNAKMPWEFSDRLF